MATSTNTARLIIRKRAAPNFLAKNVKSESKITSSSGRNASSDSVPVLSENNSQPLKITEEFSVKKICELNNEEFISAHTSESNCPSEAAFDLNNSIVTSSSDTQQEQPLERNDSQLENPNDVEPNGPQSLLAIEKGLDEEISKTLDRSKNDSVSSSSELKILKKRCVPILPKKRQLPKINLSSITIPEKLDSSSTRLEKDDATIVSDLIDHPLVAPSHTNLTTNEIKKVVNINDDTISAREKNIRNQDLLNNQELSDNSISNEISNALKEENRSEPQSKKVSSKPLLTKRALPVLPRKRPAPNISSQAKENVVNSSKESTNLNIDQTFSNILPSEGPQLKQLKVAIKESFEKNFDNTTDNIAQPSALCLNVQNLAEETKIYSEETVVNSSSASENSVSQSAKINENNSFKSEDQNIDNEINKDVKDTTNKNAIQKFLKKRVGPKLVNKNSLKVPKISTNDRGRKDKTVGSTYSFLDDNICSKSLSKKTDDSNDELSSESNKESEGVRNNISNYTDVVRDKQLLIQNEKNNAIPEPSKKVTSKKLDTSGCEDDILNVNEEKCDSISNDGNLNSLGQKDLPSESLPSKTVSPTLDISEKLSNIVNNELDNLTVNEESKITKLLGNDVDQKNSSQPGKGSALVVSSENDISKKPYTLRLQPPAVKNTVENLELSDDEVIEDIFSNSENSDDSEYTAELESCTSKKKIEKPKQHKKKTAKKKNCTKDGAKKERKPRKKTDATNKEGNPKAKAEKKLRKANVENPSAFVKLGMEVKNKNKWDKEGNCAEPEKLELKDFIFFVPKNEPMSQDTKKETKVNGEDKEEEIEDGEVEVEESHGPKLIVKDGKIMVDPNSTKIKQTPVVHGKIEKIEKPKEPNDPWELLETMKFYATLWKYGIDFSMLAGTFPKKSRDSIKKKFNFEEKNNNLLLSKTLTKKLDIKAVLRELILIDSLEKVTRKKPGSNKPPKEPRKAKKHCLLHKKKIVRNNENNADNIDLLSYNGEASNQSMSSCISDNDINIGEDMNLINLKDVITFSTNVVYKDMNIIESVSFHPSAIQPVDVNVTIRHDPEEASPLQPQPVTQDTSLK